jgi:hypothetical protein
VTRAPSKICKLMILKMLIIWSYELRLWSIDFGNCDCLSLLQHLGQTALKTLFTISWVAIDVQNKIELFEIFKARVFMRHLWCFWDDMTFYFHISNDSPQWDMVLWCTYINVFRKANLLHWERGNMHTFCYGLSTFNCSCIVSSWLNTSHTGLTE